MADTTTTRSLAGITLFESLPTTEVEAIEKLVRWRQVKAGEQILDRSSDNRDLFLVAEWSARIVNFSRSGHEVAYALANEGGGFGELAAIDGEPRSAIVVAVQKSLVATWSPSLFQELLAKHYQLMMTVVRRLARIVRTCDDRIMDLSALGTMQRVYLELLRMSKTDAAGAGFRVICHMPAHKEIAARDSTTRETVARVLSQLTSDSLIEKRDKVLYLQDREKLQAMAEALESGQGQEMHGSSAPERQ